MSQNKKKSKQQKHAHRLGIAQNASMAIFGATAPIIATAIASEYSIFVYSWVIVGICILTMVKLFAPFFFHCISFLSIFFFLHSNNTMQHKKKRWDLHIKYGIIKEQIMKMFDCLF